MLNLYLMMGTYYSANMLPEAQFSTCGTHALAVSYGTFSVRTK